MGLQKPLLIFDGDCGFCRKWISRWKVITGEEITYAPYQEVSGQFPAIKIVDFQKSVQFIEPLFEGQTNRRSAGAEAVCRSLSYHPSRRWLLAAYERVPFFKALSEAAYAVVAGNRPFFGFLTHLFWGKDVRPATYRVSTFLFTRMLSIISGIAFFSMAVQIQGLIGSRGIVPANDYLKHASEILTSQRFWNVPSIFWLNSSDTALNMVCWLGVVFSVLCFAGVMQSLFLFLIWFFYLSITSVGQEFLSFQWDVLLLEAVFLSIFFVPRVGWDRFRFYEPNLVSRFLLKFLLFKLMLLSGAVKLGSGDETWRSLTALQFHYETQPLPPWTAWYAHQQSPMIQKFSAIMMFAIELVTPFFFFLPRRFRHGGALSCLSLQVLIIMTGNYCFFNLLTIALCLLLLDDTFWKKSPNVLPNPSPGFTKWMTVPLAAVVMMVSVFQMAWLWEGRHQRTLGTLERAIRPFRTINSYGLFAVMTTQRFEIVMEGSEDAVEWKPYEFMYKPGDLSKKPRFVQPHQPRLDWQMWFAALSNYRQNPWIINFSIRLLQGEREVLRLLKHNPFPGKPPKYVRGRLYRYRFASPEMKRKQGIWWEREEIGIYSPGISLKN